MGYECRFFVVEKGHYKTMGDGNKIWADKIAMFDLCSVPSIYRKISNYPKTDIYIYADDGNTKIIKDCYGDTPLEIPIEDMIHIIEEEANSSKYRRLEPFLALLKGFDRSQWNELIILHYGH